MWVLLRLATAVFVGIVKYCFRRTNGMQCHSHGITWFLKHSRSRRGLITKRRVNNTWFGVAFRHPVFIRLSRETWADRWFKAVGLSREIQTGNAEFDRQIYVACDHPAIASLLTKDPTVPAALLRLFTASTTKIYSDGATLWVKRSDEYPPGEETLRQLVAVRDALLRVPPSRLHLVRDPFFRRALLVESLAWSAAFYSVPAVLEFAATPHPIYLDQDRLFRYGLVVALALFVVLFGLCWLLLRGSSRAHRVLIESGLVLAIGTPFTAPQIVSDVNIGFDHSPLLVVTAPIESTYTETSHRRRSHTFYYITLRSPNAGPRIRHGLSVNAALYRAAQSAGTATLEMRAGALGIPWVQDLHVP